MPRNAKHPRLSKPAAVRAWLYDAKGHDHEIAANAIDPKKITDEQLLWVDVDAARPRAVGTVFRQLGIVDAVRHRLADPERPLFLDTYSDYVTLSVTLPPSRGRTSERACFVLGRGWLVSLHEDGPAPFVSAFRAQDKAETKIGQLTPGLLLASLLDWHLGTFFAEISAIGVRADALEESSLQRAAADDVMDKIVRNRRDIAALRRCLAAQRQIFYGLSRPDIALEAEDAAKREFIQLAARFERAVDEVERTRDVLVGSFELVTLIAAHQTNGLVRVLTFVTVVIGTSGAIAGLLGMNFEMPLFKTGMTGFLIVVGSLLTLSGAALVLARRRKWL